jgi:hypothetical protein
MPTDRDKPYDVGYGRPPEGRRFRKGESGNPKGRPRGSKNMATLLDEERVSLLITNRSLAPSPHRAARSDLLASDLIPASVTIASAERTNLRVARLE